MALLGRKKNEIQEITSKIFKSKDKNEVMEGFNDFFNYVRDEVRQDMEIQLQEKKTASKVKNLSSETREYYQSVADILKAKQSLTPTNVVMPETEVDRFMDNMTTESSLVSLVNLQGTNYLTKYVTNAKGVQKGTWGEVTGEIVTELLGSFKVIDITQNKLSCFGKISMDMIDLGPTYLANHMMNTLTEGVMVSLEEAIVNGDGNDKPIGLTRNLNGQVVDGVYPLKTKIKVTDFTPKNYGSLVNQISYDENGRAKKFDRVQLLVNRNTYLTKVLPVTTILDPLSEIGYKINVFPYPTDVLIVEGLQDDEAVLCILSEYLLCAGKQPEILYSDEYKFLEDERVYKCRAFFDGRPHDNNTSIFLDLSELDEFVPRVQVKGTVSTKEVTA